MPRKPVPIELKNLIREALRESGISKEIVAQRIHVQRSQLSHLVANEGARMLKRQKLLLLADVLHLPRDRVLQAAGYGASEDTAVSLSKVVLGRSSEVQRLRVVTDPRFIDSAVFMWIFYKQPFSSIGITCEPFRTDWPLVPYQVAREKEYAVGFFNRRILEPDFAMSIDYWSDLCIYKGYALMARPAPALSNQMRLPQAERYIKALCSRPNKPVIISIPGDVVWRFMTSLTPLLTQENFDVKTFPDADFALDRFLKGEGDLYVGGLSQRLIAKKEKGCIEILSFRNNPLLFSLNSLICTRRVVDEQKPLLAAVSSLWFETVAQLRASEEFCRTVGRACIDMLEGMGLRDHSLREQNFVDVFVTEHDTYESFPAHPADLLDQLNDILNKIVQVHIKDVRSQKLLSAFSEALKRIGSIRRSK